MRFEKQCFRYPLPVLPPYFKMLVILCSGVDGGSTSDDSEALGRFWLISLAAGCHRDTSWTRMCRAWLLELMLERRNRSRSLCSCRMINDSPQKLVLVTSPLNTIQMRWSIDCLDLQTRSSEGKMIFLEWVSVPLRRTAIRTSDTAIVCMRLHWDGIFECISL